MKYRDTNRPCYKCDKRRVGCHSICDEYKAYEQIRHEINEQINRKRDEDYMMYEVKAKGIKKTKKKEHLR